VRKLIEQKPKLDQRTFALVKYADESRKLRPAYDMDRDGFTLVAMGFTGPNALEFKLDYIDAFNRMEVALLEVQAHADSSSVAESREFPNWPIEEMRAKTAIGYLYGRAYGPARMRWIMPQMGFPVPPQSSEEIGPQLSFDLDGTEGPDKSEAPD
jgi:hypothetical protein